MVCGQLCYEGEVIAFDVVSCQDRVGWKGCVVSQHARTHGFILLYFGCST